VVQRGFEPITNWEDQGSRPAQAKSYQDPISTPKLDVVVHTYLDKTERPCLKNNKNKKKGRKGGREGGRKEGEGEGKREREREKEKKKRKTP
jgi:hypothetical protein